MAPSKISTICVTQAIFFGVFQLSTYLAGDGHYESFPYRFLLTVVEFLKNVICSFFCLDPFVPNFLTVTHVHESIGDLALLILRSYEHLTSVL